MRRQIAISSILCVFLLTQAFATTLLSKPAQTPLPVFLGYTGKAAGTSEIISNLQEFSTKFGLPSSSPNINTPDFILAHSLEIFWKNGGNRVQVLSIGKYTQEGIQKSAQHFLTGLQKLQAYAHPQVLVLPEAILLSQTDFGTVCKEALLHGKKYKRFVLLDVQALTGDDTQEAVNRFRSLIAGPNLSEGAAYWPYIKLTDGPWVGASALVAGKIAENDQQSGVWKAPAGIDPVYTDLVQFPLTQAEIESMQKDNNGLAVNPLRSLPGRGIVIWGGRTLAGNDTEWRYVPVRRLAILLERELNDILASHKSSPNTLATWTEVRKETSAILMDLFRKGAFKANKASEAFYIRIGLRETMTQRDIDQGKMILEVGFAPLKPAEFIVVKMNR